MELREQTSSALASARLQQRLAGLVVKRGVALGNLSDSDRELVLALAATALPLGVGCSEAEVNEALHRALQAEAVFVATDHVELRRWLVDSGYWRRDGYGRRYERVAAGELSHRQQAMAELMASLALPSWVAQQQAQQQAQRDAKRLAWAAQQGAANG